MGTRRGDHGRLIESGIQKARSIGEGESAITFKEIYGALEAAGTAQNRKVCKRHGAGDNLFGVSFTNLAKLKNSITSPHGKKGVDHNAARKLWSTGNIDAQTFAAMIADPTEVTANELDGWVGEITYYALADVFAKLVVRTPFALRKIEQWTASPGEFVRRVGYTVLNLVAQDRGDYSDEYVHPYIDRIGRELQSSPNRAKEGMNNCLIGIGSGNTRLRDRVLRISKKIGTVEIDLGETGCKSFVVEEYLKRIYARRTKSVTGRARKRV